jgi:hypothetical protein
MTSRGHFLVRRSPEHQVAMQAKLPPEYDAGNCHSGVLVGSCPVGQEEDGQPLIAVPLVGQNNLSQVLLYCLQVSCHSLDHTSDNSCIRFGH